jgi:hypothetical protein
MLSDRRVQGWSLKDKKDDTCGQTFERKSGGRLLADVVAPPGDGDGA